MAAALFLAGCGGMAASPTPGPIVFSARPEGAFGWQLVVVNPDGSGARRLTRYDGDVGPEWSPDGTEVAFLRTTEAAACGLPACAQIWVIDADGRNARRLTPLDEDVEAPAWSPDGRRIAFAKRDLGRESAEGSDYEADICVMKGDGTEPTRLTDQAGWESTPIWSPDGDQIAFSTEDGEEGDIFGMDWAAARDSTSRDRGGRRSQRFSTPWTLTVAAASRLRMEHLWNRAVATPMAIGGKWDGRKDG